MFDEENATLRILRQTPRKLDETLVGLDKARQRLAVAKTETLAMARQVYDAALNAATMAAYANGAVTGKNQAERDMQLAAALAADVELCAAGLTRHDAELAVMNAELAVEMLDGGVKALVYTLQAAQSAAALQGEMLRYRSLAQAYPKTTDEQIRDVEREQREKALPIGSVAAPVDEDVLYRS
jgi:hypothetical protein